MIHSASSSSPSARSDALAAASVAAAPVRPAPAPSDQIHIDLSSTLRLALQQSPEIRPEVIARARAIAADGSYPSDTILRAISAVIINAPDLSEDHS
ncbi:MAG: hypothetical protein EBT98_09010 [Opitutaceae bacterium]|nr:hypothetical protein [Opitutaceae bacterium]NBR58566.1 hypothetical protein [Opitutaceae bacterium]